MLNLFKTEKMEQWIEGKLFKELGHVPVTTEDVLTYQETIEGRIVFELQTGLLIFIDETIFDINNYKTL